METALLKALMDAGAGAIIALALLLGLYRMAGKLGSRFIEAQQSQARALGAQAQSIAGLTCSIQDFVVGDNTEHREMLVLLRYIAQQQKSFEEVTIEHNRRKKQTHPNCPVKAT